MAHTPPTIAWAWMPRCKGAEAERRNLRRCYWAWAVWPASFYFGAGAVDVPVHADSATRAGRAEGVSIRGTGGFRCGVGSLAGCAPRRAVRTEGGVGGAVGPGDGGGRVHGCVAVSHGLPAGCAKRDCILRWHLRRAGGGVALWPAQLDRPPVAAICRSVRLRISRGLDVRPGRLHTRSRSFGPCGRVVVHGGLWRGAAL